ncbi:MAG: transposase [Verrucomicrobiales bacterium]|nr:transposase [Verrucomicrobiales bacterium]
MVGDKGYDSRPLRDKIRAQDCGPCIPARKNVKDPGPYDAALYRTKRAVENVFQRFKVFRRLASRFEKKKRMFFAFICCALASIYTAAMSTSPNDPAKICDMNYIHSIFRIQNRPPAGSVLLGRDDSSGLRDQARLRTIRIHRVDFQGDLERGIKECPTCTSQMK